MFDRPVVDSMTFARESEELSGQAAIENLTRLHDALADKTGAISYRLRGFVNAEEKPTLRLSVSGDLKLVCQRCLAPVDFRIDSEREFELVAQGTELSDPADEADDVEQIYAEPNLDVVVLIEDEVILSLPMVSSHEPGRCQGLPSPGSVAEAVSPFGKLAMLRRQ